MKRSALLVIFGLAFWVGNGNGQTFLKRTAQDWQKDLQAGDVKGRRNAAFALGKLGLGAEAAIPVLKQRLQDAKEDPTVREAAVYAIGDVGKDSLNLRSDAALLNILGGALKDSQPLVRRSAAYALGCLGNGGDMLAAAIADEHPGVRQNVAWALGQLGAEKGLPALQRALVDGDPLVRRDAAGAVGQLPTDAARQALPELLECCAVKEAWSRGEKAEVRKAALVSLGKVIGPKDKSSAPGLIAMLGDPDPEVRNNAAFVLSNIGGKEAAPAVPMLLDALKQGDREVRRQAAAALGNIGDAAAPAVTDLLRALKDADSKTRQYAALALGGILQFDDKNPDPPRIIRDGAARAIPELVFMVQNLKETEEARVEAATALSRLGPVSAAREAADSLAAILENQQDLPGVRERVIWALRVHNVKLLEMSRVMHAFESILGERRRPDVKMLYYDSAYMLGVLKKHNAPPKTLDVLLDFLKDETIQVYVGKGSGVTGGSEGGTADIKVKETGQGDGRIMAVQALQSIGRRVADNPEIMKQLRAIASNQNLWTKLRDDTKKLLRALED